MTCSSCGRSALGIGSDGRPYCERCADWKAELQHSRNQRATLLSNAVPANHSTRHQSAAQTPH